MSGLPHLRDVSNYQHPIDWAKEKGEVVAVYTKVGQGLTFTDPYGKTHLRNARAQKIPAGGYLYATPGIGSGEQQADRLIALAPVIPGQLRPCVDCEWPNSPLNNNPAALATWYLAFVARVLAKTGVYPTMYGSSYYLAQFAPYHPEVFGKCPLWVASYGVPQPAIPAPWHSWQAWQWTEAWKDPAISGSVDDSFVSELSALMVPKLTVRRAVKKRAKKAAPKPT